MSYDPHRTNMLPDMGTSYPITDELPAVGGGGGGPGSRLFLKVLAVLLVAAIAAVAAILVIDNQRSDQVATGDPEPTATAEADDTDEPGQTPAPTAVTEFDRGDPGYWRVVDVADGLNVRSGPGTANDVVGVLGADARHVLGTGQTATVDGSQWTEVRYDAADRVGWVSARFLASDTAPSNDDPTPEPEPTAVPSGEVSVVCFRSDGETLRVARLEFTNRTEISGIIRVIGDESTTEQEVEGTLENGQAELTLTDLDSNARSRQTWRFNPANVEIGNGRTLDVVDCGAVAGDLS